MTQFWRVERLRYDNDTPEMFATVRDLTGSHRIRINEFSFSPRSLTLHFHPSAGELLFRDGSVFLGMVQLDWISGCHVSCLPDSILTARLDIAIVNVEQGILPAQYFQGIPVKAETRWFEFLVSEVNSGIGFSNPNAADLAAEYLRFSRPHKYPLKCETCRNFHGKRYGGNFLVCGIHPYGNVDCSDFEG